MVIESNHDYDDKITNKQAGRKSMYGIVFKGSRARAGQLAVWDYLGGMWFIKINLGGMAFKKIILGGMAFICRINKVHLRIIVWICQYALRLRILL